MRGLRHLVRRNIGFALFLAWNYIALYGCAMAIGTFVPYNLEYIWLMSGVGAFAFGFALLAVMRRRVVPVDRRWGVVGAVCAVAGNVSLWTSYAVIETYWVLFAVAGLLDGVATVLFSAVWGSRLAACNEARIEFDVVICFVISFALYAVTLPIKLWGLVNLAVACLLPVLSAWLAFREPPGDPDVSWAPAHAPDAVGRLDDGAPAVQRLGPVTLLIAAQWFIVALFRVIDAPIGAYDRYQRYFIAFATGFLVTVTLVLVLIRSMRYVNMSMSYRWLLPLAVLNLAVLCFWGETIEGRMAAYTVIHAGMFGMQMAQWIALAKFLRRRGGRPGASFVNLACAQGAGIFLGCAAGLLVVGGLQGDALFGACLVLLSVAVLVIMMTGFNPAWYFVRNRRGTAAGAALEGGTGGAVGAAGALAGGAGVLVGGADVPGGPAGATGLPGGGYGGAGALAGAVPASAAAASPAGTTAAHGATGRAALDGGVPVPTGPQGGTGVAGTPADPYDALMHRRAVGLRRAFGLTERETEVAELLLCGRSRPYIRDELGISLNTVHAHARSILAKCGVHSQRELIDVPIGPEEAGA